MLSMMKPFLEQYGTIALFLSVWFGVCATPVPDELVVLGAGGLVAAGLIAPLPAFAATVAGVMMGLMSWYLGGRLLGAGIERLLSRLPQLATQMAKAQRFIGRWGGLAAGLSRTIPGVSHGVHLMIGQGRLAVGSYLMGTVPVCLVWTLAYFELGWRFGDRAATVIAQGAQFGPILPLMVGVVAIGWVGAKRLRHRLA